MSDWSNPELILTDEKYELSHFTSLCHSLFSIPNIFGGSLCQSVPGNSLTSALMALKERKIRRIPGGIEQSLGQDPLSLLGRIIEELSILKNCPFKKDGLVSVKSSEILNSSASYFSISQLLEPSLQISSAVIVQIDWNTSNASVKLEDSVKLTSAIPSVIHHNDLYEQTSMVYTNGSYSLSLVRRGEKWVIYEDHSSLQPLKFESAVRLLTLRNMYPILIFYSVSDVYKNAVPFLKNSENLVNLGRKVDSCVKVFRRPPGWECKKCAEFNPENSYQCRSCKVINWDVFYSIQTPKPQKSLTPVSPRVKRIVKVARGDSSVRSEQSKVKTEKNKEDLFPRKVTHKATRSSSDLWTDYKIDISKRLRVPTADFDNMHNFEMAPFERRVWRCKQCQTDNCYSSIICRQCKLSKFQTSLQDSKSLFQRIPNN